jgi:phosphoribosylformylglycinamidine synthase subunit PurSL
MPIQTIRVTGNNRTEIYRFESISKSDAQKLATQALTDPVTQSWQVNPKREKNFLEVGYKPGVTDPTEQSLLRAAKILKCSPTAVSSSHKLKSRNETISQIEQIISHDPKKLSFPKSSTRVRTIPIRSLDATSLAALSKERSLFLSVIEMEAIANHYRSLHRDPTDIELETFAQTWSEHCIHKTFKALLITDQGTPKSPLFERLKKTSKKYFKRARVITAFSDNAGGIDFMNGFSIIGKGETHNSPVALEPYAGSLTKNGGLFRDIAGTGKGGETIASLMINNFAPPTETTKKGSIPAKHLLMENSRGERNYGNPMGIPTHSVALHFHPNFGPKPTSLGVALGLIPNKYVTKGIPHIGDLIISVGGKTGRDGIHGATFSSSEMTDETHVSHGTAVQLGDPITERAAFDALLAARDAGLIRAITDCGAGGYASAVGEMAEGLGAKVRLDKIPQKYAGLEAWEKWLSESQERMVVCVEKMKWTAFEKICTRFDTEATIIGEFEKSGEIRLFESNQLVGTIDLNFLHHGLPQLKLQMGKLPILKKSRMTEPKHKPVTVSSITKVISSLNLCSKELMLRQYDQTVQGMTVLAPLVGIHQDVPADGTILAPELTKKYGIALSYALNPNLIELDPYWGSVWTLAQAATKLTAIGGNISQAAGIDNFIWPSPDPSTLASLDASMDGLCDAITALKIPMVSGKDSLSSTYRGPKGEIIKVPPSLNITLFGKVGNISQTISPDFKHVGSSIYLLGNMDFDRMGGSAYYESLKNKGGEVPHVDLKLLPHTLRAVLRGTKRQNILSTKAIGEGGLITALSMMCFGGECGAELTLERIKNHNFAHMLFNETAGCLLAEVTDEKIAKGLFGSIPHLKIGHTVKDFFIRNHKKGIMEDIDLSRMKKAWQKPMQQFYD